MLGRPTSSRPAAAESGPFVLGIDPATDNPNINYATSHPRVGFRAAGRRLYLAI
jgi:hypothetical protein